MRPSAPQPDPCPDVEAAASRWLAEHDRGLTPESARELAAWLAADPRHATVFRELERTWRLLDGVRRAPEAALPPNPDAFLPRRLLLSRRAWLGGALAAAAVVAIGFFGLPSTPRTPLDSSDHVVSVATAIGETRTLPLPDGSVVVINTDTALRIRFAAGRRDLALDHGEAHFTVAKDPARPFVVTSGGVAVRAVGTAFNVRRRADALDVLVTEGRVQIAPDSPRPGAGPSPPAPLAAGERLVVPFPAASATPSPSTAAPRTESVSPAEIDRALAWREHRLEFVASPLSEVVAEFNRHNRHRLVIADAQLAQERFGGSFRAHDLDTFLRLLAAHFEVRLERTPGETRLHFARPATERRNR